MTALTQAEHGFTGRTGWAAELLIAWGDIAVGMSKPMCPAI